MAEAGDWLGFERLDHAPECSLEDLFATKRAARHTFAPRLPPRPRQAPLLWPQDEPAEVLEDHRSLANPSPVRVYAVAGAEISGPTHCAVRGRILTADDLVPNFINEYYVDLRVRDHVDASYVTRRIPGPVFVVTHFWSFHYGHFLLECLGRVLLCRHLHDLGHRHPIALSDRSPPFIRAAIECLVPGAEVIAFREDAEILLPDLLLLPGMGHGAYDFHPFTLALLDAVTAALPPPPDAPRKLYLSRARVSSITRDNRLLNEPELAAVLAQEGYAAIHLQELDWATQLALLRGATHVIGECGSALHGALFSPALEQLVSINRINPVQQRIADARNHPIGFIPASDGTFFTQYVTWDYAIDVPDLVARLRHAPTPPGPARQPVFNPIWYLAQNPDVASARIDPLEHFATTGWRELRNPSPLFDTGYYLATYPDVRDAGIDPFAHYLAFGRAEGRHPRPPG